MGDHERYRLVPDVDAVDQRGRHAVVELFRLHVGERKAAEHHVATQEVAGRERGVRARVGERLQVCQPVALTSCRYYDVGVLRLDLPQTSS
jgi:hypothetical protein